MAEGTEICIQILALPPALHLALGKPLHFSSLWSASQKIAALAASPDGDQDQSNAVRAFK